MLDPDSEHYRNQLAAWKSWHEVFEAIIYFNDPQPVLKSPKTRFIPSEDYPRIMDMVEFCMDQPDWCCLINGDIVITPHFKSVEMRLKARSACAAASWRHEFDPARGIEPRERVDNGLDFFAANPWLWSRVYADCPEQLRMSCLQWDSWMLGYFSTHAHVGPGHSFFDITPSRCVCHPRHSNESRKYGPAPSAIHFHGWPTMPVITLS